MSYTMYIESTGGSKCYYHYSDIKALVNAPEMVIATEETKIQVILQMTTLQEICDRALTYLHLQIEREKISKYLYWDIIESTKYDRLLAIRKMINNNIVDAGALNGFILSASVTTSEQRENVLLIL